MGAKRLMVPELPGGPVLVDELAESQRAAERRKRGVRQARREVARLLPEVIRALGTKAADGSVAHVKLFLELSGVLKGGLAKQAKVARARTLEEVLVEQWDREKALVAEDEARERARRAADGAQRE